MTNNKLAQVFHFDLYGKREDKYDFLNENNLASIDWNELQPNEPNYFMVNKDFGSEEQYCKGFLVSKLFPNFLLGPNSHRDDFAISFEKQVAQDRISDLLNNNIDDQEIKSKYNLVDNRDWKLSIKRKFVSKESKPIHCLYRPFDNRYMLYGEFAFDYHRPLINDNLLNTDNYCFITTKQTKENFSVFISNKPLGQHKIVTPYDGSYLAPLYNNRKINSLENGVGEVRVPNLNMEIVEKIEEKIKHVFVPDENLVVDLAAGWDGIFNPLDLLDYIYAVLHSPSYREKYKEFLKIDFPRVPYPKNADTFWQLVKLGSQIRQIHLLESSVVEKYITQYPMDGDNVVGKTKYENGKVYINEIQYFANVPQVAWEFYIGGYQPAQKWLKDRKDRTLDFEDILHYQKIIVALSETDRLMKEVDKIEME